MIQTYGGIIKDISIIICTRNNEIRLGQTLEAIGRCTTPPGLTWEIIVVDNNSSDGTSQIVKSHADKLPLYYLFESEGGLSQAKNKGLAEASGHLVIFGDDDIKPVRTWIQVYWENFKKHPSGRIFGGPVQSEFEHDECDPALLSLAPASIRGLDFGHEPRMLESTEFFIGSNWACPAAGIHEAGYFDLRLGLNESNPNVIVGEEQELISRLERMGYRKWYIPDAKVYHHVPAEKNTLKHIVLRKESGGYSDVIRKDFTNYSTKRFLGFVIYHSTRGLLSLIKYRMNSALGRKDYPSLLTWKRYRGIIRALVQKRIKGKGLYVTRPRDSKTN